LKSRKLYLQSGMIEKQNDAHPLPSHEKRFWDTAST